MELEILIYLSLLLVLLAFIASLIKFHLSFIVKDCELQGLSAGMSGLGVSHLDVGRTLKFRLFFFLYWNLDRVE